MANWWENDPVAQSNASASAAEWWRDDPVADPEQARRASLDAQVRREMAMSPDEWEAHVREQRKQGLPYRAQPGTFEGSTFGNLMIDPFGLRDEISGAGQYVRALVTSGFDTDKAAKAYSDTADIIRAEQRVGRENYGIVPEIIGGFGTSAIGAPLKLAPNLFGRAAQSAKVGASYGAVAGATQGEGGVTNRLVDAAGGAATGAVAGPLLTEVVAPTVGAVARGAKAVASPVGSAVNFVRGKGRNLDARLNAALEDQNMTPRMAIQRLDEAQDASKFGKTQLDSRFTIADTGPSTRDLTDTAALVSRQARTDSSKFLGDRSRDQFGRVNDYLKRSLSVTRDDFARTQSKLVDEQRSQSAKAYAKAYADPNQYDIGNVLFNRQFDDFAAAGPLRRALGRARALFVESSQPLGQQAALTTERFDAGKRALDDMIQSARQGGRNNEARLLTQLKNELLDVIDQANPAYKQARDVYSSRADMLDALDAGRSFMRGDAEFTGEQYRKLSTGEKRMFRIGIAREVRKVLGGRQLSSDSLGFFDRPNTRAVLEEIMTPSKARKFYQLIDLEQAMAATNQAVRGNSKTAQRQQDVLDFSFGVRLGRAIKDQGLYTALSNEIFDQITKVMAMREADAVAVTRALLETDPAKQRETLNRLIATYGKGHTRQVLNRAERIARRQLAVTRRRLAGLAGEIGAGPSERQSQPQRVAP